jgi:hypothetical protein
VRADLQSDTIRVTLRLNHLVMAVAMVRASSSSENAEEAMFLSSGIRDQGGR